MSIPKCHKLGGPLRDLIFTERKTVLSDDVVFTVADVPKEVSVEITSGVGNGGVFSCAGE